MLLVFCLLQTTSTEVQFGPMKLFEDQLQVMSCPALLLCFKKRPQRTNKHPKGHLPSKCNNWLFVFLCKPCNGLRSFVWNRDFSWQNTVCVYSYSLQIQFVSVKTTAGFMDYLLCHFSADRHIWMQAHWADYHCDSLKTKGKKTVSQFSDSHPTPPHTPHTPQPQNTEVLMGRLWRP